MPNIYRANFPDNKENRISPPYNEENRGCCSNKKNNKKKKLKFKDLKCNTVKSLNEIECFLNNIGGFVRYIKLYKLIKK